MQDAEFMAPAYILQNTVFHSRHLPTTSKHSFTYPTVALLVSLPALESHKLDLGLGRLFGYSDAGSNSLSALARVTGIRPEAYLHDPESYRNMKRKTIRDKLEDVLKRYGHNPNGMGNAWMLTMPSYLGIEGINPLTVFYCYKKGDTRLWVVVLEVHNTFGERHVYVLPTGPQHEGKTGTPGFTHSWTFPRQFHVSPFNDRSGYYTCSLVAPPHCPFTSTSPVTASKSSKGPPPLPKILIQLWTPDKQLKLTASLRSTASVHLTTPGLLMVLASYPFTLLLSFVRIAWQAFHLHYRRRLDVYARPEPRSVDPTIERSFRENSQNEVEANGEIVQNAVQEEECGELDVGGGVGWQPEGPLERFARRRIEQFLEARARTTGIRINLVSTNPAYEQKTFFPAEEADQKELTVLTRSSRAFLLIFSSPSAGHALLLARDAEQLLQVSNDHLFLEVFSIPLEYEAKLGFFALLPQKILQWIRKLPVPRTLLESKVQDNGKDVPIVHPLDIPFSVTRPPCSNDWQLSLLRSMASALPNLLVLSSILAVTYLEKLVFMVFRARFIRGTEPWDMWVRTEAIGRTRVTDKRS